MFEDVLYNRSFDPYDETPHCGLARQEHWIADVLQSVVLYFYPPFPPDKRIDYKLLLPSETTAADSRRVKLLGCVANKEEDATWKEIVVFRDRNLVQVFNLVSHARHMYRVLVYSSDHRFSLHGLAMNLNPNSKPQPLSLRKQSGNFRIKRIHEASLQIIKRNVSLHGHETYVPKRLLAGLVPTALLESHTLWMGEDGIVRGIPQEAESQWSNYNLSILLPNADDGRTTAHVLRQPLTHVPSIIKPREVVDSSNMLVRSTSLSQPTEEEVVYNQESIDQLMQLGFTPAVVRLALKNNRHNTTRSASWLLDSANIGAISNAAAQEATASSGTQSVDEESVANLASMGFSDVISRRALSAFGTVQDALSWLTSEENRAEIERIEMTSLNVTDGMDEAPDVHTVGLHDPAELLLLDLLQAPVDSELYRYGSVLSRLEDFSHVLVWAKPGSASAEIALIELPRLKV